MTITLKDIHISNTHAGIVSSGPVDLIAENVTFDNVKAPYVIKGANTAQISGTRIRNDPKLKEQRDSGRTSIGWTKSDAPPLPVMCPLCKSVFASQNYFMSGLYFNMWGNEEECRSCGYEHAQLSDGIFDLNSDIVNVLTAPDITYVMLQAIADVANEAASGKISMDAAAAQLVAIAPKLKGALNNAMAIGVFVLAIVTAYTGIAALQLMKEANTDMAIHDANQDRIQEAVLRELQHIRADMHGLHETQPHDSGDTKPCKAASCSQPVPKLRPTVFSNNKRDD